MTTLKKHIKAKHSQSVTPTASPPGFTCEKCQKKFCYQAAFDLHRENCGLGKPFQCSTCGKCFTRKSTLEKHVYEHTQRGGGTKYLRSVPSFTSEKREFWLGDDLYPLRTQCDCSKAKPIITWSWRKLWHASTINRQLAIRLSKQYKGNAETVKKTWSAWLKRLCIDNNS